MPNKNYKKGRRREYYILNKKLKEKEGFTIAQRTAGSHSPFDIIAINPETKIIKLVQCKPKTMSETKQDKIREENKKLNGEYEVVFEVR